MTTDRAFIAALQQSAAPWRSVEDPASTPGAHPTAPAPAQTGTTGPHYAPAGTPPARKAPLSEHLARRRASAEPEPKAPPAPLRPGIEVPAFAWPADAARLAADARQQLLNLLSAATKEDTGDAAPTVALVGAVPGVGSTASLLAMALVIEGVGGKVAIFDASPSCSAASALGVRRSAHPAGRIDDSLIDDLLVTSRAGGTSVLAAGAACTADFAATAVERLATTHDLVLIDTGDVTAGAAVLGLLAATAPTVLLLDTADGPAARRTEARRQLDAVGCPPIGLVETLADRC